MRKADKLRKLFNKAVKFMNSNNDIFENGSIKPDRCKFYNNLGNEFKRSGCLEPPMTIPYCDKDGDEIGFTLMHPYNHYDPYNDEWSTYTFTEVIRLR